MEGAERRAPKRWTDTEDDILFREARSQLANGQIKDWNRIAAKLTGRTNKDCRKRWINKVCGSLKKGTWDESEDERLQEGVRIHGSKWVAVANVVGLRSPDQCAKRWQYSLDPRLEDREWSSKEDELLLSTARANGCDWKLIHDEAFPTRSTSELKTRYSGLIKTPNKSSESRPASSGSSVSRVPDNSNRQPEYRAISETAKTSSDTSTYQKDSGDLENQWVRDMNDAIMVDAHGDTLGTDWLQQMEMPYPALSQSAVLYPEDVSLFNESTLVDEAARPDVTALETVLERSPEEILDTIHVAPSLQWTPEGSENTGSSTFSALEIPTSDWTTPDMLLCDIQPDPMALVTDSTTYDTNSMDNHTNDIIPLLPGHPIKKVSLTVDKCDSGTLEDLLSCVKKLNGKVKLEIGI